MHADETKRVNVILCTYNGGAYLPEQLQSLLDQTYRNIRIYIKDDGSSDNTMEVIDEWVENYNHSMMPGGGYAQILGGPQGLGYPDCFFDALMNSGDADYYAFCDQDDIWQADKIERAVERLNQYNDSELLLYYSAFDFCDSKMNYLRPSYRMNATNGEPSLLQIAFSGGLNGFVFLFNKQMRDYWVKWYKNEATDFMRGKDIFLALSAAALGHACYDERSYVQYRRYPTATSYLGTNIVQQLAMKAKYWITTDSLTRYTRTLKHLKDNCTDSISVADYNFCKLFASDAYGVLPRIRRVAYPRRLRVSIKDELSLRVLFLIGKGLTKR